MKRTSNAFNKEILRSITGSIGRFLAIAIICALGCGFYAGLLMSSIDMNLSADSFYDETNLSDIYVTSTLGLDDAEIESIAQIEGVKAVEPVRMTDVYVLHGGAKYVMRFNSLDIQEAISSDTSDGRRAISNNDSYINRPILVEGSWPTASGECVIAADAVLDEEVQIGDTIEIIDFSGDVQDTFARKTFIVTGLVRSPYYVMTSNLGSSDLGSGEIDSYLYISPEDFNADYPYTGAFVIVDGAKQELYPSDEYSSIVDAVVSRLEHLSNALSVQRLNAVKAEAQAELNKSKAEYDEEYASAMSKLQDASNKLDESKLTLDDAAATLATNKADLESGYSKLEAGNKEIDMREAQLVQEQQKLDAGIKQYQENRDKFEAARPEALKQFDIMQQQINLMPDEQQRAIAQQQLDAKVAEFKAQEAQLDSLQAELEQGTAKLEAGKLQLNEARAQAQQSKDVLDEGKAKLEQGYDSYHKGLSEYESGLATYQSERVDALNKLTDAKSQIDEAQEDIDSIEAPDIYILDRSKNVGTAGHEADASRINQIAQVFPLIFFLVAALVSLTTMTRMVDEERMLIGTYKALGYSNKRIISKYLIYALVASGIGSIIGVIILSQFLPQVIMQAYSIIYAIPVFDSPINIPVAIAALLLSVGITLIATWIAAIAVLREKPAALLLPRAPKPGKRILLERTGPLWRSFSFSSKVTARNIFRYKSRFFMAIIGIAGCTALLLTGLGLHDGINDIIEKQFNDIQHFNLEVQSNSDQNSGDKQDLEAIVKESNIVTDYTYIDNQNVIATNTSNSEDVRASLVVPEDAVSFGEFYTLRTRVGHQPLHLDNSGAVITEKLASELGVHAGDTIELYEQSVVGERSGSSHQVKISGVAEYYTGQRIFMMPELYEQTMGKTPEFTDLISMAEAPLEERTNLSNQILDIEGVEVVSWYDEIIETYKTMLGVVNAVVYILIAAAAILAFVVLYNLTNINITERTREIATLKVLGFTPRETNAYIFRETIILTIIGALIGCILGIWMEGFVIVTAEIDQMMFGRDIHLVSFAIAFVLTIVFSCIVSLFMSKKIKDINMVESLKSVD